MKTEQTSPPEVLGSPSGYASFWGKLLRKWDWWIYCRAFHSLRRMTLENPGMGYLMELQIREWNEKMPISQKLRHATERFHESMRNHSSRTLRSADASRLITTNTSGVTRIRCIDWLDFMAKKTLSPINRMIDAATGHVPAATEEWQKPRDPDMHDKQVALEVSQSAIDHIREMYPKMFEGVPSAARVSLGNHIYNKVLNELRYYQSNNPLTNTRDD